MSATQVLTLGHLAAIFSTSGRKARSKHMISSSAWLMMYSTCSGNRRGLTVLMIAPMPDTAKYSSKWRWVFHASVPTRDDGAMPSETSAFASCRTRRCASR